MKSRFIFNWVSLYILQYMLGKLGEEEKLIVVAMTKTRDFNRLTLLTAKRSKFCCFFCCCCSCYHHSNCLLYGLDSILESVILWGKINCFQTICCSPLKEFPYCILPFAFHLIFFSIAEKFSAPILQTEMQWNAKEGFD